MEPIEKENVSTEATTGPTVTTGETTAQMPDVQTPVVTAPFYKNKQLIVSIIVALALIGGAGYYVYTQYYAGGGIVAVVNGKNIYKKEFDESVALIKQTAVAQGIDLTQPNIEQSIQEQAMTTLVNNVLILSAAGKAGFKATDEEIQKKYDELVTQLGTADELKKRMAEVGLTEEKLRSNIAERTIADQYIESTTTIKELAVTEEEVQTFLKAIDTGAAELPPLEEIRPQIEAQILGQKQQQLVADLIERLRTSATIELKM